MIFSKKTHLDDLLSVKLDAGSLSNNLGGEDDVVEHGLVNGSEGARAGPLLLLRDTLVSSHGLGKNASLQICNVSH